MQTAPIIPALRSLALTRLSPRYSNILFARSSKLCFFPIPKNANSYLKALILYNVQHEDGSFDPARMTAVQYLKTTRATFRPRSWKEVSSDKIIRLAVLRNPYARLVSCFVDKLVKPALASGSGPGLPFAERSGMRGVRSFRDFAEAVCAQPDYRRERHVRSQAHYLYGFPINTLHHLGTVERLERTIIFLKSAGISQVPEILHPSTVKHTRYGRESPAATRRAPDFTADDFRAYGIPPRELFADTVLEALVQNCFREDHAMWLAAMKD